MCNAGVRQFPHPKDGGQCLYPIAAQIRDMQEAMAKKMREEETGQTEDFLKIAAQRWRLNEKPPQLLNFLKIVGNTLKLS